jgi:hypothetical protein
MTWRNGITRFGEPCLRRRVDVGHFGSERAGVTAVDSLLRGHARSRAARVDAVAVTSLPSTPTAGAGDRRRGGGRQGRAARVGRENAAVSRPEDLQPEDAHAPYFTITPDRFGKGSF